MGLDKIRYCNPSSPPAPAPSTPLGIGEDAVLLVYIVSIRREGDPEVTLPVTLLVTVTSAVNLVQLASNTVQLLITLSSAIFFLYLFFPPTYPCSRYSTVLSWIRENVSGHLNIPSRLRRRFVCFAGIFSRPLLPSKWETQTSSWDNSLSLLQDDTVLYSTIRVQHSAHQPLPLVNQTCISSTDKNNTINLARISIPLDKKTNNPSSTSELYIKLALYPSISPSMCRVSSRIMLA